MAATFFLLQYVLLLGSILSAALAIQDKQDKPKSNDIDPNAVTPRPTFKVTDLMVTYLDSTQAEVHWLKPNEPVTGYTVVICAILRPLQCQHETQVKTEIALHQLRPNTMYEVRVMPFDHRKSQNFYGDEEAISFTTLPLPRLDDIDVYPVNSTSVDVKWTAVSGANILIQVCPVPSKGNKCPIYHTSSDASELRIDNLEPGTLYTVTATFSTTAGGHSPDMHVSRNVTTPTLAPKIEFFDVLPLNPTSLEVMWKSEPGAWILITVCPAQSNQGTCSTYTLRSERSQFTVDNLKPRTLYTVRCMISPTAAALIDSSTQISKNITTPANGNGGNAASLSVFSCILTLLSLLHVIMR